jgi:transcription initiation factor TFIIE subunit alpha
LVKLAARAFYDDITTKGDNQPKTGRSDNRGIAVVVLDALTRFALTSTIFDNM